MIEIKHLQKVSGTHSLLHIESLTVQAGQIVAIVGPVGSGKSELLALLLGQSQPTAGEARLCGLAPCHHRRQIGERVGVAFRDLGLYERRTVRNNLVFHCILRGLPARRADEVLAEVGLVDQANIRAGKLSPNLARRLAYGRAILHQPQVLLMMEPFSGCDTVSCEILSESIYQKAQAGCSVLILSHEGIGLASLCSAIYSLNQGRLSHVNLPRDHSRHDLPFKIPARQEGQVILINPADLLYAIADDDQTRLHTLQGQSILSHLTMGELEARLGRNGFFRAHRSYLVNLQRVKAVIPYTRDSYTLILDDQSNTEIPLSKSAAKELRDLLGY
ncbi:MAG: LytTR family transcriptional regulator DNA-binding domain-containing protein [Anaerolineae bacterium]|nr:LytTR family transcriptional regulator DNA-binding domain-containing protein [Anaerolineae bacterium]